MQPHFAPSSGRALFFAQESTDVPSPSFDHLRDYCRRVETVSCGALFKLTFTHTQLQSKAHPSWRPRRLVSAPTFREQIPRRKHRQPWTQRRRPEGTKTRTRFGQAPMALVASWAPPNPQSPSPMYAPHDPHRDSHEELRRQKRLRPCPPFLPDSRAPLPDPHNPRPRTRALQCVPEAALQRQFLPISQPLPASQSLPRRQPPPKKLLLPLLLRSQRPRPLAPAPSRQPSVV